jgi:hypothetical protein
VLLDLATSTYFTVNPVGAVVLDHVAAGTGDLDKLTSAVVAEFDVAAEVARADTRELLDDLVGRGFVVPSSDT